MKKLLICVVVALLAGASWAGDTKAAGDAEVKAAFARLKGLAGTWEADTEMGKARLTYEVVANGSAVIEREEIHGPEAGTMYTVYHLDGGKLRLTHYCMAGNQPRMVASRVDAAAGEIVFSFEGAGNLASADAGHMRSAQLRLVDDNNFTSAWTFYENGKPKFTTTAHYKRVR